jgi:hypothetical protein
MNRDCRYGFVMSAAFGAFAAWAVYVLARLQERRILTKVVDHVNNKKDE